MGNQAEIPLNEDSAGLLIALRIALQILPLFLRRQRLWKGVNPAAEMQRQKQTASQQKPGRTDHPITSVHLYARMDCPYTLCLLYTCPLSAF